MNFKQYVGKLNRPAYRLMSLAIITVAVFLFIAIVFADNIIFQPPSSGLTPARDMLLLPVAPGISITARHLKNPQAYYTILYSHGNGDTLQEIMPFMEEFQQHGYNVIAYDYEGYGASQGKASETNCYRDIAAVYDYLTCKADISPPERIIIYGHSVGSGPSCHLASYRPAAGLVLESPFLSAFRVVCPMPMPFDKFPNHRYLAQSDKPLLVFHGTEDEVIPFRHGKTLFESAPSPRKKFVASPAGHNNIPDVMKEKFWRELEEFFPSGGSRR